MYVLLLCDNEFPESFESDKHPDDYKVMNNPITPELIYHTHRARHDRLWMRMSWKLYASTYMPVSFLLDTGACKHLYASDQLIEFLQFARLAHVDPDLNIMFVRVFDRKAQLKSVPTVHRPCIIMGSKLQMRFGLKLQDTAPFLSFQMPLAYLC